MMPVGCSSLFHAGLCRMTREYESCLLSLWQKSAVKRKIFRPVNIYRNISQKKKENWLFHRDCMAGHMLQNHTKGALFTLELNTYQTKEPLQNRKQSDFRNQIQESGCFIPNGVQSGVKEKIQAGSTDMYDISEKMESLTYSQHWRKHYR